MEKLLDRLIEYGKLKFTHASSHLSRILGIVMAAKVVVLVLTISGLSGCLSSVPSTFPEIQVPSQPTAGIPTPSSSTSQPSGSGTPQPPSGGSQSSTPSPSLPTPGAPGSGTPSLPRPPSPMPSPDSSNGNPSLPSIPSPSGQDSPESGDADGGTTMPDSNSSGEGGQGSEGKFNGRKYGITSGRYNVPVRRP